MPNETLPAKQEQKIQPASSAEQCRKAIDALLPMFGGGDPTKTDDENRGIIRRAGLTRKVLNALTSELLKKQSTELAKDPSASVDSVFSQGVFGIIGEDGQDFTRLAEDLLTDLQAAMDHIATLTAAGKSYTLLGGGYTAIDVAKLALSFKATQRLVDRSVVAAINNDRVSR